ncbi:Alpha 1,3 fucosyltransferase [Bulinus truncatus]|nr:Alpha 1,3 fucosyltransferase [Bulinus truncatus]
MKMRIRRYFKFVCCAFVVFMFWTLISYLFSVKDEDFPEDVAYDVFVDETKEDHVHIPLDQEIHEELQRLQHKRDSEDIKDPVDPIILWWTEFTKEPGAAFLFYGTDFNEEDLPLPRSEEHIWALFHEESPKNKFLLSHGEVLSLFNYTSTFRQESDFPITTQHLVSIEWLQQMNYYKTVDQKNKYQGEEGLATAVYVQSDCDPPSDRDEFVKMLMKYVSVDSYGTCINNRQLPSQISQPIGGMSHSDFYELISRYKFALAMENAVCPDYITEKLWRPLMVGTVPVVFGSSRVQDFLPDNNSAIVLTDYKSAEHLGTFMDYLNKNDFKYEEHRAWKTAGISNQHLLDVMSKRTWAPTEEGHWIPGNKNFIEEYECYLCRQIHKLEKMKSTGIQPNEKIANVNHYGCPKPLKFDMLGRYSKEGGWLDFWGSQWDRQRGVGLALKQCISTGNKYCGHHRRNSQAKKDF